MSSLRGSPATALLTCIYLTALYAVVTIGITYLVRALSSVGNNMRMLNIATSAICFVVPVIMAQQEWDDHDRSRKTLAPDLAKDYLESCAQMQFSSPLVTMTHTRSGMPRKSKTFVLIYALSTQAC
jgi:hypothetical protein